MRSIISIPCVLGDKFRSNGREKCIQLVTSSSVTAFTKRSQEDEFVVSEEESTASFRPNTFYLERMIVSDL